MAILERWLIRGRDRRLREYVAREVPVRGTCDGQPITRREFLIDGALCHNGSWGEAVQAHRGAIRMAEHRARERARDGDPKTFASALIYEMGTDERLGIDWLSANPAPMADALFKFAGREETYAALTTEKKTPEQIAAVLLPAIDAASAEQSDEPELLPPLPEGSDYEAKRAWRTENLRRQFEASSNSLGEYDDWEEDALGAQSTADALEAASWDRDTLAEGPPLDDRARLWGTNNEGGGTSGR